MDYSEAANHLGIDHAKADIRLHSLEKLPMPLQNDIRHPLVLSSVRSAVRVLNCLRKEFGQPDFIRIELPRDLAKSADQREEMEKAIRENEGKRVSAFKKLVEAKLPPIRINIRKVMLWEECAHRLPYSPHVVIDSLADLINGAYEIDHIVPRSHNFDNSFGNLVLCSRDENQAKRDRTPFEAFGEDDKRWKDICQNAKSCKTLPKGKRFRLTNKERPDGFAGRHLSATGYIGKSVLALSMQMVSGPEKVTVTSGSATAELRRLWGLDKVIPLHPEEQEAVDAERALMAKAKEGELETTEVKARGKKARSNFKHHCLDAIVIGLIDTATSQRVTQYYKQRELSRGLRPEDEERERQRLAILPDPNLRVKVLHALETCEVVHRAQRRISGELHKQQAKELMVRQGKPWTNEIVDKKLIRYDHRGQAAQAYPLGNNHHVAVFERILANKKGVYERYAVVVSTIEAAARKAKGLPVVSKTFSQPGWKYLFSLCKGDMVEMRDGTIAVVSKFSAQVKEGDADLSIWHRFVAQQAGKANLQNPYLVARITTASRLSEITSRVVLDPLGSVAYQEGPLE